MGGTPNPFASPDAFLTGTPAFGERGSMRPSDKRSVVRATSATVTDHDDPAKAQRPARDAGLTVCHVRLNLSFFFRRVDFVLYFGDSSGPLAASSLFMLTYVNDTAATGKVHLTSQVN